MNDDEDTIESEDNPRWGLNHPIPLFVPLSTNSDQPLVSPKNRLWKLGVPRNDSLKMFQNADQVLLFLLFYRLNLQGKNVREEPKGIIFVSKWLLLFQFCHLCFFPNPTAVVAQVGTMLIIETECSNCGKKYCWRSQPGLLGEFPAGNLLLSLAIFCPGASVRKMLLVFPHMGVLVYHEPTYYYHQRHLLIP